MMKRILCCTASFLAIASAATAGELRDNVGIGLGTMIFENGNPGLVQQVLAATTNGSCGNQTFAISSGTCDAKKPDSLVQNKELREFVAGNMDNLARDIASARGESLDTLAELLAVPADQRTAFNQQLQANFQTIYPNASVTHLDVINNLERVRANLG